MSSQKLTSLTDYRLLGKSGLRVSPLCLGTMTFGTEAGWGADKEESRKVFDLYVEEGGNFIDTADAYTGGTSEAYLGEFMSFRRDRLVIATKYTCNTHQGDPNAGGNHRKNMIQSVEASLKRLQTDYIDLYWLHMWEFRTPVEEVMRAFDDLVRAGKVLYIGISDAPAWKVSQANTLAELRGWTPFIALQIEYSLIERTVERDLTPMAQEMNIGVVPWSPLGGGVLTGKYNRKVEEEANFNQEIALRKDFNKKFGKLTDKNISIAESVQKIAKEIGRSPAQVALNWLLQKPGVVSPIIGARTFRHLVDNLQCLDFVLSPEHLLRLDEVSKIELGFPHDFLASNMVKNVVSGGTNITR
ncbi:MULTISPECIES: aldo/keto reductase [Aerosakkonema]|uniref:aldo/keto reductase n=1 Tax=Aerosakkonema TaxID=1246629 RepID=UPI0035BB7C09